MGYRVGPLLESEMYGRETAQKDVPSTSLEMGGSPQLPSQPSLPTVHTSEWLSLWVPTGSPQGIWRLDQFP